MQFKPAKPAKPLDQPPEPSKDQAHGHGAGQPKVALEADLASIEN